MNSKINSTLILTLSCPDRVGIVSSVTKFISEHGGWIVEASQHGETLSSWFFMRVEILTASLSISQDEFRAKFEKIVSEFQMQWRLHDTFVPKKAVVLVSKSDHCLSDLLHRYRNKEFNIDIACVISNHEDLRSFVEWHEIPFHHVPVEQNKQKDAFEEVDALYQKYDGELMVLARYMQILPPELCRKYLGQIINIHHSFLPSFAGPKPYHQAYELGVKLIGATCHYVTEALDAGPIIEQGVIRVSHSDSVEDMTRLGKDVEKSVLAKGLRNHVQDRVLIHGNKTIVFN